MVLPTSAGRGGTPPPMPPPPGVVDDDGYASDSATTEGRGGPDRKAVWEFNWENDKWHAFDNDCQTFIESRFSRFQGDHSQKHINVKTKGFTISVDFERMTQKKQGKPDIKKVRRRLV
mmetsp:Transcript_2874/g.7171  ORF Transcript_2874/g.7171 Transcript_2874/m.7171 type:complete len:118 (+) Transcript_2874:168-521(+)